MQAFPAESYEKFVVLVPLLVDSVIKINRFALFPAVSVLYVYVIVSNFDAIKKRIYP
jgi:hypothetical protein